METAATRAARVRNESEPATPRPKTTVRPVKFPAWDDGLRTTVLRTIGHRASCSCGWRGRIRRQRPDAKEDELQHRAVHDF